MKRIFFLLFTLPFFSCTMKQQADLLIYNGKIYTVDSSFSIVDAAVVKDGKFIFAGDEKSAREKFSAKQELDLKGKCMFPGLIDAHCHFLEYGLSLFSVNLVGTKSWDEVLQRAIAFTKKYPDEKWIVGRGWDQNDWAGKSFPTKEKLDSLFPNTPVFLERVDGHAAIVNSKALLLAKINAGTKIDGGKIILQNGNVTGVLLDNAKDVVFNAIPKPTSAEKIRALLQAQQNCFAVGLTTLDDAATNYDTFTMFDSLQKKGDIKMRFYCMLYSEDSNNKIFLHKGTYKTDRLNVRAFKFFADGALGSRGAKLLQPYSDDQNNTGLQLKPTSHYRQWAEMLYSKGFQMCTHAIGDSANRMVLHVYGNILKQKNDRRWRIEHCQVVDSDDFDLFKKYSILPSVQATHATSDMYWAEKRLGSDRIKGAYAYKKLLNENGVIANGTDFPVENINPFYTFYASIARKDHSGFPANGFQTENALTREETLKSMTIWAAYFNFEEKEKGSIERGKFADFVVLNQDIMTIPIDSTWQTQVLQTWINGENVFTKQ
jgi:predicted amidohydrolase YtcJ